MENTKNFTEGKILAPLVKFALPVLFAIFLQTMYGAVDMLIVGQFGTAADVSAVSTGSWIMQAITSTVVGLSMGTTILLGQRLGQGRKEDCGKIVGASLCFFVLVGLAATVLTVTLATPFARLMQAPQAAFEGTVQYVLICGSGSACIVAYNLLGSMFRGIGNAKMPLVTVAISCVLNIGGDLLLVGWFRMGVAGAAIATVFAQLMSVVFSLLIIRRQGLPFSFTRAHIRFDRAVIGRVIKLGFPIALQDLLVCISFLAITAIVNGLGVVASAGVGVAEKICGFVLLVPSAYMQAMSAFVAQNIGAQKPDRAKKALICGIATSLGVGVFLAYFAFFHGDLMAGLFSGEAAVIAAGAQYLKAYAIDCLLVSFLFCFMGYFNGCGKTTFVMAQGIIGAFCVRIPVSYLMSRMVPISLFAVGLATPCSTVVQILLCFWYFWRSANRPKAGPPQG